ncbi:MAG: saccharopine dehydrogenase C-terminal domain-containing protein [Saprospiraceae bacterium]
MSDKRNVIVVGAGGIGRAVGLILANYKELNVQVFLGDVKESVAQDAANWVHEGLGREGVATPFVMPYEGTNEEMTAIFEKGEVVLDCLPGSQAPRIAKMAREHHLHYANLTEYVAETDMVVDIAQDADTGFVVQTGLAPGFINVLGNHLFQTFCKDNGVDQVDKLSMKVGALTRHAVSPHFYGFTWSPIGVATEYVEDAIAVRNYKTIKVPALSERQTIIIDNITYEDNLTSGGAADLPQALEGKVKDLDYKTLRYPGHYGWVSKVLSSIPVGEDTIEKLQETMLNDIPSVEDDVVIVYACVKGKDKDGVLRAVEKSYTVQPMKIGNQTLRAIQSTTAAPLAEAAVMLLSGKHKGVVFQSDIDPLPFLNGPIVSAVYGKFAEVEEREAVNS